MDRSAGRLSSSVGEKLRLCQTSVHDTCSLLVTSQNKKDRSPAFAFKTRRDMKDQNEHKADGLCSAAFISPLVAAGSGAAFVTGLSALVYTPSLPMSFYFRNGVVSGGLFFLALYSGKRAWHQNELSRSICIAGYGAAICTSVKLSEIEYGETSLRGQSLRAFGRSGFGGALVSLGLYDGARTIFEV